MARDQVDRYAEQVRGAKAIRDALDALGVAEVVQTGHIVTFRVGDAWIAVAKVSVTHEDEL